MRIIVVKEMGMKLEWIVYSCPDMTEIDRGEQKDITVKYKCNLKGKIVFVTSIYTLLVRTDNLTVYTPMDVLRLYNNRKGRNIYSITGKVTRVFYIELSRTPSLYAVCYERVKKYKSFSFVNGRLRPFEEMGLSAELIYKHISEVEEGDLITYSKREGMPRGTKVVSTSLITGEQVQVDNLRTSNLIAKGWFVDQELVYHTNGTDMVPPGILAKPLTARATFSPIKGVLFSVRYKGKEYVSFYRKRLTKYDRKPISLRSFTLEEEQRYMEIIRDGKYVI